MEKTNRILKRSEIAREDTWAIEDLYTSDELWEQELATLDADKTYLQTFAGRLGESGETLCTYLLFEEKLSQKISKLASYCMRMSDVHTRNATYQAMVGKFMSIMVAMGAAQSFETPEIMAIPDRAARRDAIAKNQHLFQ
jgi:oligoendopeptidase F